MDDGKWKGPRINDVQGRVAPGSAADMGQITERIPREARKWDVDPTDPYSIWVNIMYRCIFCIIYNVYIYMYIVQS